MRRALRLVFDATLFVGAAYQIAYLGVNLDVLPAALSGIPFLYRGAVVAALMLAVMLPLAFVLSIAILQYMSGGADF